MAATAPRRPRGLKVNRPTVRSSSCPARPHGQRHAVVRQAPRPPTSAVIGPGYSHARSATTTVLTCRAAFAVSARSLAAIALQQGHRLSRSTSRPAMSRVAESVWNEAAAAKRLELRIDIKAVELRTRRGAPASRLEQAPRLRPRTCLLLENCETATVWPASPCFWRGAGVSGASLLSLARSDRAASTRAGTAGSGARAPR